MLRWCRFFQYFESVDMFALRRRPFHRGQQHSEVGSEFQSECYSGYSHDYDHDDNLEEYEEDRQSYDEYFDAPNESFDEDDENTKWTKENHLPMCEFHENNYHPTDEESFSGYGPVFTQRPSKDLTGLDDFGLRLHRAVWDGDCEKAERYIIEKGICIESFNHLGQTPLFIACYLKDPLMTKLLLNLGADPNQRCTGGYTPVHAALFSGSKRILQRILEAGADLEIQDCNRQTPIDWIYEQSDKDRQNKVLELIESVRRWTFDCSNEKLRCDSHKKRSYSFSNKKHVDSNTARRKSVDHSQRYKSTSMQDYANIVRHESKNHNYSSINKKEYNEFDDFQKYSDSENQTHDEEEAKLQYFLECEKKLRYFENRENQLKGILNNNERYLQRKKNYSDYNSYNNATTQNEHNLTKKSDAFQEQKGNFKRSQTLGNLGANDKEKNLKSFREIKQMASMGNLNKFKATYTDSSAEKRDNAYSTNLFKSKNYARDDEHVSKNVRFSNQQKPISSAGYVGETYGISNTNMETGFKHSEKFDNLDHDRKLTFVDSAEDYDKRRYCRWDRQFSSRKISTSSSTDADVISGGVSDSGIPLPSPPNSHNGEERYFHRKNNFVLNNNVENVIKSDKNNRQIQFNLRPLFKADSAQFEDKTESENLEEKNFKFKNLVRDKVNEIAHIRAQEISNAQLHKNEKRFGTTASTYTNNEKSSSEIGARVSKNVKFFHHPKTQISNQITERQSQNKTLSSIFSGNSRKAVRVSTEQNKKYFNTNKDCYDTVLEDKPFQFEKKVSNEGKLRINQKSSLINKYSHIFKNDQGNYESHVNDQVVHSNKSYVPPSFTSRPVLIKPGEGNDKKVTNNEKSHEKLLFDHFKSNGENLFTSIDETSFSSRIDDVNKMPNSSGVDRRSIFEHLVFPNQKPATVNEFYSKQKPIFIDRHLNENDNAVFVFGANSCNFNEKNEENFPRETFSETPQITPNLATSTPLNPRVKRKSRIKFPKISNVQETFNSVATHSSSQSDLEDDYETAISVQTLENFNETPIPKVENNAVTINKSFSDNTISNWKTEVGEVFSLSIEQRIKNLNLNQEELEEDFGARQNINNVDSTWYPTDQDYYTEPNKETSLPDQKSANIAFNSSKFSIFEMEQNKERNDNSAHWKTLNVEPSSTTQQNQDYELDSAWESIAEIEDVSFNQNPIEDNFDEEVQNQDDENFAENNQGYIQEEDPDYFQQDNNDYHENQDMNQQNDQQDNESEQHNQDFEQYDQNNDQDFEQYDQNNDQDFEQDNQNNDEDFDPPYDNEVYQHYDQENDQQHDVEPYEKECNQQNDQRELDTENSTSDWNHQDNNQECQNTASEWDTIIDDQEQSHDNDPSYNRESEDEYNNEDPEYFDHIDGNISICNDDDEDNQQLDSYAEEENPDLIQSEIDNVENIEIETNQLEANKIVSDILQTCISSDSSSLWVSTKQSSKETNKDSTWGGDVEDLYYDDDISSNDPNLQLQQTGENENEGNNDIYPSDAMLADKESILSMDIQSPGPSSLSYPTTEAIIEAEPAEENYETVLVEDEKKNN